MPHQRAERLPTPTPQLWVAVAAKPGITSTTRGGKEAKKASDRDPAVLGVPTRQARVGRGPGTRYHHSGMTPLSVASQHPRQDCGSARRPQGWEQYSGEHGHAIRQTLGRRRRRSGSARGRRRITVLGQTTLINARSSHYRQD
ncbi:hypothetical protein E2C01_040215 [Portunus trituberculatus]|uniref:Uncharacterized protein n=1 Tax=Portunus trituberculatus TaxID=210409 RepID=A0A5B7FM16_PORTR|nr:hypothetical protein [Portunus trituberculatus]